MIDKFVPIKQDNHNLSNYSVQLNRWFLKSIGAWPSSSSTTKLEKIISFVLIIWCYCFICFTVIPCLLHVILEDDSFHEKLKVLGPLSHWLVGGINYTTLLLRNKEIRYCIEHMQRDWEIVRKMEDQQVMIKHAKIGRYITMFCTAFMQGGVLSYCAVTAFSTQTTEIGNETRIVHMIPCRVYKKLIAADTSPTNEIVIASQFVSGFIVNSSAVGAVSIAAVFTTHACGQVNLLMAWIRQFVDHSNVQDKNVVLNDIGEIIRHHLRILSFITGIENVMSGICFMELFKCTVNICMLGYYILTAWTGHDIQNLIVFSVILLSMIFNIFIICYIGDILTEQCKMIGEAVYMTNWYYLPGKDILNLIQIILRSSMVVKITAYKLVHMSIYTFSNVIKTAFAYLNLLRQMT
ncbi:odorant receptor 46a-like [Apis laboriosa]|uniref:odorant receptor 46a-like n=1 Tax=Apis laboriosa TaxID=183418 RepID=UPI001CC456E0|nr:odorant receptor 46a-like [Apis laboriosa]